MKKFFLKVLFVIFSLALTFGLGACSASSNQTGVTKQELISKNHIQTLILENNGLNITETCYNQNDEILYNVNHSYAYVGEELICSQQKIISGEVKGIMTAVDGAVFSLEDGKYGFSVLTQQDALLSLTFKDLTNQNVVGNVNQFNGRFILSGVHTKNGKNYFSDYLFNEQTLKLEEVIVTERDAFGKNLGKSVYQITANQVQIIDLRQEHLLATDNITVELNIIEEDSVKTQEYCLSVSTELICQEGYEFYKTENFNKDTENLYFAVGDRVKLYYAKEVADIIFEYRLTQNDIDDMYQLICELNALIEQNALIEDVFSKLQEIYDLEEYISAQAVMLELLYYQDLSRYDVYQEYALLYEIVYNISDEMILALKNIYESDYAYKQEFFAEWTQEDINSLYVDENLSSVALEMRQIENEFNMLPSDKYWEENVRQMMVDYVQVANNYANLCGYTDYYNYASKNVYLRDYSVDELQLFRSYIKQYVVPMTITLKEKYLQLKNNLTASERAEVSSILYDDYTNLDQDYLQGYIDSYDRELNTYFSNMFDKNSIVFSNGPFALSGAFVTYIPYYEEPLAYFSSDYLDVFTIVHEMGHYASAYTFDFAYLNYDFCEVHSQANEWLLLKYLEGYISKNVYESLYYYRLYEAFSNTVMFAMVDEFEYNVYTADTPYTADQLDAVMTEIYNSYNAEQILTLSRVLSYWKYVTLYSPVYYLSYATSQIASLNFLVLAEQSGYNVAQQTYLRLQTEGEAQNFKSNLILIGLVTPFEEQTFINMVDIFT